MKDKGDALFRAEGRKQPLIDKSPPRPRTFDRRFCIIRDKGDTLREFLPEQKKEPQYQVYRSVIIQARRPKTVLSSSLIQRHPPYCRPDP